MLPLAITSGEPAGIGPDICLALADEKINYPYVVLADARLLRQRAGQLALNIKFIDYQQVANDFAAYWQQRQAGELVVLDIPCRQDVVPGVLAVANAPYVLQLIDQALSGVENKQFSAIVTAPLHKGIINQAGIAFSGHTEYLAEKTQSNKVVMMLAGETAHGTMRVALATTHIPLRKVADSITSDLLRQTLTIMHQDLQEKFAITQPRILVAGLNPHAGEQGYLGREEIEVINPTLQQLRNEGMQLIGALPADTMFTPPVLAQGDAVLAMYHDQGLAVLKYATFGQGINITLGLPILRTSVDHGTALDIAATGKAKVGSLLEAINQAGKIRSNFIVTPSSQLSP